MSLSQSVLPTITLAHSTNPAALRLVADAINHTLGGIQYTADPALQFGTPQKDDSGRISITLTLGNQDRVLDAWFFALNGSSEKPVATLRWYGDDGTLLLGPVIAYLHEPTASGATVTAELRSKSDEDLPAAPEAFSLENTPTLRGLRT